MITIIQTLGHVAQRSRIIAEFDPHGAVISLVSIVAVFLSLLILFLAYLLIGKCVMAAEKKIAPKENTIEPAITAGPAENEKNIITIRSKTKVFIRTKEVLPAVGANSPETSGPSSETSSDASGNGVIISPLPGAVLELKAAVGDKVSAGTELAVIEAMKMENSIESEYEGTVTEIYVSKGDTVLEGTPLMKIA